MRFLYFVPFAHSSILRNNSMQTTTKSAKELSKGFVQHLRNLNVCLIKRKQIIFYSTERPKRILYKISLSECSTAIEILEWCLQISDKNWTTINHLKQFIFLASEHHKLELK